MMIVIIILSIVIVSLAGVIGFIFWKKKDKKTAKVKAEDPKEGVTDELIKQACEQPAESVGEISTRPDYVLNIKNKKIVLIDEKHVSAVALKKPELALAAIRSGVMVYLPELRARIVIDIVDGEERFFLDGQTSQSDEILLSKFISMMNSNGDDIWAVGKFRTNY